MTWWVAQVHHYQLQLQWTDQGAETAFPPPSGLSSWPGRCEPRAVKVGKVHDVVCPSLWPLAPPPLSAFVVLPRVPLPPDSSGKMGAAARTSASLTG